VVGYCCWTGTAQLSMSRNRKRPREPSLWKISTRHGRAVRPELYSDTFRKLCRQAGVRTIHLHLVRHTLVQRSEPCGVPIVDAAALMGHTPETYMRTYLRPTELGARSAASALGAALAGVLK
jgi:integrase